VNKWKKEMEGRDAREEGRKEEMEGRSEGRS
jgi:hypothetical protein